MMAALRPCSRQLAQAQVNAFLKGLSSFRLISMRLRRSCDHESYYDSRSYTAHRKQTDASPNICRCSMTHHGSPNILGDNQVLDDLSKEATKDFGFGISAELGGTQQILYLYRDCARTGWSCRLSPSFRFTSRSRYLHRCSHRAESSAVDSSSLSCLLSQIINLQTGSGPFSRGRVHVTRLNH